MRRLLAMTVMTVTLVGVTPSAALAGGMLWHSKLYHAPGSAVEPPTETEPLPVDRADPASGSSAQSVPFDSLWLTIAGIVGLSLVARTVFSQSRWPRHPASDQISRNRSGLGDVRSDE